MDRRLLLPFAFAPVVFYVYACGGDDEAPPPPDTSSSSSGGSSSGNTSSSSGNTSSSGGQNDSGDPDTGAPACGNPLVDDAGGADGGATVSSDGGLVKLIVTANTNFLDGPTYSDLFPGGALVYSEVFTKRLMRVPAGGGSPVELRQAPGNPDQLLPIGNAATDAGILTVVADEPGGNTGGETPGIITTTPEGGAGPKINVPAEASNPNDLVVGPGGIIFFTDPQYQNGDATRGAYRVNPDGGVETVKSYPGESPDGIALSPDNTILYVAMGGTGKRIDRFTVGANGATAVANPATLQAQYADDLEGIATDTAGNIWVAESARATNPDNPPNGGRVEVFSPAGAKLGEISFPQHRPINIAFGGADNKTVFIVTNRNANAGGGGSADYSGQIFTFTSLCPGVR